VPAHRRSHQGEGSIQLAPFVGWLLPDEDHDLTQGTSLDGQVMIRSLGPQALPCASPSPPPPTVLRHAAGGNPHSSMRSSAPSPLLLLLCCWVSVADIVVGDDDASRPRHAAARSRV
jgi:hypothetical protein